MNAKISVTMMITKARTRTSISSAVSRSLGLLNRANNSSFNFLLQNRCYEIFGAGLVKLTSRLLTLSGGKVIRILAIIPIGITTSRQQ
jgi:hypothetical protein